VDNASFYVAWTVATLAFVLPGALATVLYAVGAREPALLAQRLRMTFWSSIFISVIAGLVTPVVARPVLMVFGAQYAQAAFSPLVILVLSGVPVAVRNHYIAVRRIRGQVKRALPVVWIGTGIELALALIGAEFGGLHGLCLGWLLAVVAEAIVMLPVVVAALHSTQRPAAAR